MSSSADRPLRFQEGNCTVQLVNYLVTCFSYDRISENMFHKNVSDNISALSRLSEMPFCAVPYKMFIQDSFCSCNEENSYVLSRKT